VEWELQGELRSKVNLGFSMRYLASGVGEVNLADYLLRGGSTARFFLGGAEGRGVVEEMDSRVYIIAEF